MEGCVFIWRPLDVGGGALGRSAFALLGEVSVFALGALLAGSAGFSGRSEGLAAGASSFKRASTAASRGVSQSIVF